MEESDTLRKSLSSGTAAAISQRNADVLRVERDEAWATIETLRAQLDDQLNPQRKAQPEQAGSASAVEADTRDIKGDKSEAGMEDAFAQPLDKMYDWSTTAGVCQNDEGWWS